MNKTHERVSVLHDRLILQNLGKIAGDYKIHV